MGADNTSVYFAFLSSAFRVNLDTAPAPPFVGRAFVFLRERLGPGPQFNLKRNLSWWLPAIRFLSLLDFCVFSGGFHLIH